ncbi:MAG: ABC transporter ATP-binding protein/permease [Oscillibacter sp.]|nr:ABC transporter ATP-binding protein/permease [Oscillibacter sp.]
MKKKNSNPVGALKRTGAYMSSSMGIIIFALVLAALSAVMTIIGPDKIGKMATIMSDGLFTGIDLAAIAKIGVFLAIIYCLSALFGFIQHYIMAVVTLKMSYRMRGELSEKINRVPQKYFNTTSQGDILSRITNDVSTLQQGLTNSLPTIISAATQFVGCLIMMFVTEWRMALVALCITLLGMVLIVAIMSKSQRYFTARQKSLGELNGYVEEMYSGHEVVRISRAVDKVLDHFDGLNAAVYDANWRSQFLSGVMQPLMNVIGNLSYVAVCVFGSVLAINGTIEFGVIVSFILYVRLFTTPLTQIAQGMTNLQMASASAHRIFDFLESEELGDESDKTEKLDAVRGAVTFDHVRFSYPDSPDKIIIKDFSAKVHPGQKVAIVGPTGAGKTTMVNLLMRFFEVNSGRITIDGVATTDLRREDVHELFGMVLQDTWLFEGTIRENLVYNMEGITDEQLETVCKACGLDKFVHSLPQGFDTVLSESTTISAGQKQLLTIARAMLQNAPMLILDEATSSVDTRTELLIQRAMDELTKGRTSFVIAHRLSTIKNADLILVMRDGDVIESGTHEQLMEQNGFYAELYNSQFAQAS